MSGSSEEKKNIYRLTPCPAYDVEGMESWLESMAEQGLFLTSDGFFCGFGFFHEDTPRKVKYRLEASEVQGGFFADNDEPEEEQQELSAALGWEFVARRGEFYIYRSFDENVRELNTDPQVQALTLKMVQKRQWHYIWQCILWCVVFPLIRKKGTTIAAMLYMKSWFYLFSVALIIWFFAGSVKQLLYYAKLRRKLKQGENLNRKKNWKKRAKWYPARVILQIGLCFTWVCIVLGNLGRTVLFEDKIPLQEYNGTPPFAVMEELIPQLEYVPEEGGYWNTVIAWQDVLAPVNFIWRENGEFYQDGEMVRYGLWEVDYHELRFEWMAKLLAKDYYRMDQERDFEFLYELDFNMEEAFAYRDEIRTPTVILRHGNKVVRASFHEFSYGDEKMLGIEEWAKNLAESIR